MNMAQNTTVEGINTRVHQLLYAVGSCTGVAVVSRGIHESDHHLMTVLVENRDHRWRVVYGGLSTEFLPGFIAQLQSARTWIARNGVPDGDKGWRMRKPCNECDGTGWQ
jgi:hypothetical protein